jgi:hypothetical protein
MKHLTVKSGGQPEMRTKLHYGSDITDSKIRVGSKFALK